MTLTQALAFARAHEPHVRQALANLSARRADARVPLTKWMPQVGGVAEALEATANNTTASYLNVPEVDFPRIGGTSASPRTDWAPSASTLLAVSANQEVFDFGRTAAEQAVADARTEAAKADAQTVDLDIQLGVEEAFHAVLAAKQVVAAADDAYKRAVTHRDYAAAGSASGLRSPIVLTRAQADVALLNIARIRTQSGLQLARSSLAAAMGSDAMEVDAVPLASDEAPAPALDEVIKAAQSKNPAVAAALARIRAQELTALAISKDSVPNLFASAAVSSRAGGAAPASGGVPIGSGWLPDVANWSLGLVLQWDIYDATILARSAAATAQEQVARADLDVAHEAVVLAAERAYLNLEAALRELPGLRESTEAARANQSQADARFQAGLGTVVELADAEALLTNSEVALAVGMFNVARSRAELGRAMGDSPLPEKEP